MNQIESSDGTRAATRRPHEPLNRVVVRYRREGRYLYGAISKMGCDPQHPEWHDPFLISKDKSAGEEELYGTVVGAMERVADQFAKMDAFFERSDQRLREAGHEVGPDLRLPESGLSDVVVDEQDRLIEEVLLATSIHVRRLLEIFPEMRDEFQVAVYDYEKRPVSRSPLRDIGNLMAHSRYIAIRESRVIDLMSDQRSLAGDLQTGLQFDFIEYLRGVSDLVASITVKDLAAVLQARVRDLSPASDIGDIIFLLQNLYTLGGFVVDTTSPLSGPVRAILDRIAPDLFEREWQARGLPTGSAVAMRVTFTAPRFEFEGNLENKKIRTSLTVNGQTQTLDTDYEQFFRDVVAAAGTTKLWGSPPLMP